MTDFQPIAAFGGQLQFPTAYGWNATQIIDFLSKVAANPATYGAPADRKTDFQLLHDFIVALRPGGASFNNPIPVQQILRKNQTIPAIDPTKKFPWTVNNLSEAYFIIFDLLGVFLSLMGSAPTTGTAPTAKNYFLPLVVVYARWCRELAKSKGFTPTVAQITWSSNDSGTTWYSFLGSSANGFEKTWKELVGQTRHGYLGSILGSSTWPTYGMSPARDANSVSGTNFGNCGETYPFLYILADATLKTNSYGIALKVARTTDAAYNGANYWALGPMLPPCMNCQELLKLYGVEGRLPNFKLWEP